MDSHYKIILSNRAKKDFYKFDRKTRKRILSVLKRAEIDPFHNAKKLTNFPYYRLRCGDYRIIVEIFKNKIKVHVIRIGLRKKIYDLIRGKRK